MSNRLAAGDSRSALPVLALSGLAAASLAGLLLLAPIPQDQSYHQFADQRTIFGIPNFWNVISNLPFLAVGAAGVRRFRCDAATVIFFLGVLLTGLGSSYYHWSPDDGGLFWDRLPMTVSFAAILALVVAERVGAAAGAIVLWPALAIGVLSLLLWQWADDLRLYFWVQFFPALAAIALFSLYAPRDTGTAYWIAAGSLYALAKLFEFADDRVYSAGGLVSGHTLKHFAAAAACFLVLRHFARKKDCGRMPARCKPRNLREEARPDFRRRDRGGGLPWWAAKIAGAARSGTSAAAKACGIFAAASAGILPLAGCGEDGLIARFMLKPDRIIVERRPDPVYDRLFPYYVELCATSQFRSKLKGEGGVAGHAVMYIKGACKDEEAPYPQLRRCRAAASELADPEHGAGVSVGRWFRNVNWVAIPGYELFYKGNLKSGERLTQAHFDATVQEAIKKGVYKGVEFHGYPSGGGIASLENFVANEGIGTDLALQFARSVFCARLPMTEPMVDEIIAFLNDKNREYAEGEADYNWSVWADNCAHTLRNALAAANIWSPLSVRDVKLRQIFNLAVPANEFVNLAELGTIGNIGEHREIQRNGPERDALHEFDWLPTRHGALLKTLPVHAPNDLYDTDFRLFTLQSPFRMGKTQRAIDLLSDSHFVKLDANLQYFREKYDAILAGQDETRELLASVRGTPYRRVERLFWEYIKKQRAEVASMIDRLATLGEQAEN